MEFYRVLLKYPLITGPYLPDSMGGLANINGKTRYLSLKHGNLPVFQQLLSGDTLILICYWQVLTDIQHGQYGQSGNISSTPAIRQ